MKAIEDLAASYMELEQAVRELITELFGDACGLCTCCCCRPDICEETTQSAFLMLLLERSGRTGRDISERYGWLDLHGCSLEHGRPPVCYTFFCDELLAKLPDPEARLVIRVLGRLPEYAGEEARPGRHLVEIGQKQELEMIDCGAVAERLETAMAAVGIISEYLDTGKLGPVDREQLESIGPAVE